MSAFGNIIIHNSGNDSLKHPKIIAGRVIHNGITHFTAKCTNYKRVERLIEELEQRPQHEEHLIQSINNREGE